jgi:NADH-quinone oxidoreductase subunit M
MAAIGFSNVQKHTRQFHALGLIMIGGLNGAFASLDLFFLYTFHEFALIPTFILIGLWGAERRRQAAMKITLYLAFGSLVLLLGLLGLYYFAGAGSSSFTFDLVALKKQLGAKPIDANTQIWLFGILFFGFGILVSIFPFHTWAPMGYGEAPPLASMLHAGVIKKFGIYGIFAVAIPLLPEGFDAWKPYIVWLAVGNLVYCGYVALQQKDLRYMLAYASVSHMGYAFLALASGTPVAHQGLMLFLFAHGITAALGFGIAGHCREQTGTSNLTAMGGLAKKMPFAATVFTMTALASCGLPGFANFPAELMIFIGSFHQFAWETTFAIWTVVITAVYQLRAVRNIFLGQLVTHEGMGPPRDMDILRKIVLSILLLTLLMTGFWPRLIQGNNPTVPNMTASVLNHE